MRRTDKHRTLEDLEAETAASLRQTESLLTSIRAALARGTADVTAQAGAVSAPATVEASLSDRVTAALSERPLSLVELSRVVRTPVGRLSVALRPLRKRLWNAGTQTDPQWFLPPGPDAPPDAFRAAVRALVRCRPMTTAELCAATGTAGKRVWHALVWWAEQPGSRLVRLGDPKRPRWQWIDESIDLIDLGKINRS